MARRYAPVMCSIWDDDDFVALDLDAQRLYILLLSQKKLSMVGVVPYAPRNWSRGCQSTNADDIRASLMKLEAARFVIIDHETDELLVRTMLKHDPPKGPKSRAAMWRSLAAVDSETLRREAAMYIDDDIWDDQAAEPPDDLKYLRNAPSDPPPDGASDGARTRARASSDPPATDPPATDHRVEQSSSVLTVVRGEPDDDDFSRTVTLIVDAKVAAYKPNKPRAYALTVRSNTITEDGDLIRRMLVDDPPSTPEQAAAFVLGYGFVAESERKEVPWCDVDCSTCNGDAWIDTGDGLAPCPNRGAA